MMCFKIKVSPAMEVFEPVEIHQVLVKLLDGNHKILNFNSPSVPVATLKHRIQTLTSIPSHLQLLVRTNSRILHDHQALILNQLPSNPKTLVRDDPDLQIPETLSHYPGLPDNQLGSDGIDQTGLRKFPVVVHLLLRLRGGKGGFGSLLRGAATKAGQKKTNNFDACRDMSGRRLRHVNAEKKLEEWRAEAEERKLEKMAEEFMKKKAKEAKKSGKGTGGDGADKYVAKYREDSARCMEEVERSVRESVMGMASSKRKSGVEGSESDSKRLKIWLGKRTLADSDSEDVDEDDSEKEEDANEKSVIIDSGNNSDSSKEAEASSGSVTGGKLDAGSLDQGSSESGSEVENWVTGQSSDKSLGECSAYGKGKILNGPVLESIQENSDDKEVNMEVPHEYDSSQEETIVSLQPTISSLKQEVASAAEVTISNMAEPVQGESVSVNVNNSQDLDKPLNFDDYNSAAELEVLGMERLKSELQARGLKCGGTLQERAARLFLLKTTPIEMLPKKLFAKK